MEVKIVQNSGDYDFHVNGQLVYTATPEILTLHYKVSVYAANEGSAKFTVKQSASMFSVVFDITHADKTVLQFKVTSARKHHFQCQAGNDTYDIYGHKIETCSVYKNNTQVAWWDLKYSTDQKIIANSDCDLELLIAFFLLTNRLIQVRNDGQGIAERLVTNISEERPFDPDWHPQHEPPPLNK